MTKKGCSLRFSVGYNSFGDWSALAYIREIELERGNEFPDLSDYPDDTPAIWLTRTPREALRYSFSADTWDRITAGGRLTAAEQEEFEAIASRPIEVRPTDVFVVNDGDGGHLVLRPVGDLA